ncbi:MAG: hypothetical protein ACOYYS_23395 [Chloroflexota bacterium]
MSLFFFLLTILAGLTIPLLPILAGFFPRLGLTPLKLAHHAGFDWRRRLPPGSLRC